MNDERAALDAAADVLGLSIEASVCDRLLRYLALLRKWNKVYNLTSVRDPADMLTHHLFDSLAVVRPLLRELERARVDGAGLPQRQARVLDAGSGAGLPGIVIALCSPEIEVTCVDAVAKKAAFVGQAAAELGVSNLRSAHARVESMAAGDAPPRFNAISARAFASLGKLVDLTAPMLAENGVWLAMKGKAPAAEIAELPVSARVFHVEQLEVPSLEADRCIVWMRRS